MILSRRLQVGLGVLWLVDAGLQCQPFMFTGRFADEVLRAGADGQPAFVAVPAHLAADLVASAPALFNLGLAMYKLSRLDKAEEVLKRALDVAPRMSQIHLALANVYLKLKRYDNLLDQLNTYLEQNPKGTEREQVERLRDQVLKAKSDGTL